MTTREIAIQSLKDEAQAILDLIPKMDDDFERAVDMMLECKGKVIVTGVGKSGHIGAKIAATLASTGTPSFFINPLDVYHGDLGVMSQGDVVLAISNSGQTDELLRFIPMVLHMQTATLAMGDALAIALMEKRHFRPQDFAQFHPGGELGKRLLTTAQDVMITENLPVLSADMHLGKAIIHVSKGKLGLGVAIEDGKIAGLITDGDIRRAMEKWQAEFFNHTVEDIMTRTPKTVGPQAKISDIQKIMNKHKIHNVLVVDSDNHLMGIVDRYACVL